MRPFVICAAVVLAASGSVRATCPLPAETAAVDAWFNSAFLGQPAAADPKPPGIELIRQDHGILGKNRSSRNTAPLKLGEKTYTHGIGTHSTSELRVRLTEPARTFTAEVGIDNNWDTRATHGSVVFVVETGEKELFRSDIRRGSSPVLPAANPYALRSTFGGAICLAWDPRPETFNAHLQKLLHSPYHPIAEYSHQDTDAQFDPALAKRNIQDFKNLRPLALGDFYPLLPYTTNLGEWIAYQFHRADLGRGMVLCFRRGGAYAAVEVSLQGLESSKNYHVTFSDCGETRKMTGVEFSKPLTVMISPCPGSAMILYEETSPSAGG